MIYVCSVCCVRSLYNADKTKLRNEIERLTSDLDVTRNRLNRELEWKEQIDNDHKALLQDKRDMLTQLVHEHTVQTSNYFSFCSLHCCT